MFPALYLMLIISNQDLIDIKICMFFLPVYINNNNVLDPKTLKNKNIPKNGKGKNHICCTISFLPQKKYSVFF